MLLPKNSENAAKEKSCENVVMSSLNVNFIPKPFDPAAGNGLRQSPVKSTENRPHLAGEGMVGEHDFEGVESERREREREKHSRRDLRTKK